MSDLIFCHFTLLMILKKILHCTFNSKKIYIMDYISLYKDSMKGLCLGKVNQVRFHTFQESQS